MLIKEVIGWYEKMTDYPLSDKFIRHMVDVGIIGEDVDIDKLNSFLIERVSNKPVINENGKFKVKENRKRLIDSFDDKQVSNIVQPKQQQSVTKFKIEKMNGNRLKLVVK